jgi:hypothetical protein
VNGDEWLAYLDAITLKHLSNKAAIHHHSLSQLNLMLSKSVRLCRLADFPAEPYPVP